MKFYLKNAFFVFLYVTFSIVTSLAISNVATFWLKMVLYGVVMLSFVLLIGAFSYGEGKKGYDVLIANNKEREIIVKTGQDRPLKEKEEYAWYKGLIIGGIVCIPLIVGVILNAILTAIDPSYNVVGTIVGVIYMMFYTPLVSIIGVESAIKFYVLLYAVPFILLTVEIPYILGSFKSAQKYEKIENIKKIIKGN